MTLYKEIESFPKDKVDKKDVLETMDKYNILDVPKRMNISTLMFKVKMIDEDFFHNLTLERQDDFKTSNGDIIKEIIISLDSCQKSIKKTQIILESINSKMYKIKYIKPCEVFKQFFPLWTCETNFVDDLKDS